ncbi:pyridoxamine 5'-phosphate oxidase family protein [Nocardioides sp. Y6]|uniref:Pyridoxamine 5'-phosphate oxidase family protein n=1 Tax=Nocardioides malaquae TaxID=2773426 RepID=A0ABR9RSX2_9ACTN|nr:pyridoxamine 5'-phosphate oxidase family protein [Nocardioides malaquae]MBE7324683.1 pyridoxamine 5'-phosphate oxidase family protein [Nocardioides malaquae]
MDQSRGESHARIGSAVELSRDECWQLLSTQQVGRVAYVGDDGPRIVPVNYVLREGHVEFRTTSYSELATHAPGHPVAFEVDELDTAHHAGWSVVVTGRCERAMDEFNTVFSSPTEQSATPWAGGRRPMVLRIEVGHVSGRHVGETGWHHPEPRRS